MRFRLIRIFFVLMIAFCLLLAEAADSVLVRIEPLEKIAVYPEASAPATVMSLSDSRISAEINARVEEIPVQVGDVLDPGGVLVRLDCTDYELAAAELEAQSAGVEARIGFSRQQLARARKLERQRTISEELMDQRESELASLLAERDATRARLAMARRRLDKCTIRAPFKAAVLERLASVGEYAAPGAPLIRVLDVSHLEVSADLITEDVYLFKGAEKIVFRNGVHEYPLRLRALTPMIDPMTRTREARLLFDGAAALPGATGRLVWTLGKALPPDLLVRRGGRLGVLLAEDGKARFFPIPDAQEGRPAAVNLPPQTPIITEGRYGLSDGDPIVVVE